MDNKSFYKRIIWALLGLALVCIIAFIHDETNQFNWQDGRTVPVEANGEQSALRSLWSGYYYAKSETQALEDDWTDNPGRPFYDLGQNLWKASFNDAGKSCAGCHNEASKSMIMAGQKYPLVEKSSGKLVNLQERVNLCRKTYMDLPDFPLQSRELLALTAYVRTQSKGRRVRLQKGMAIKPYIAKGKQLYYSRIGQLNLACSNCHEKNYGVQFRSDILSQGHSNGFPGYFLKYKKFQSLPQQIQNCNKRVRAKPFALGSDEMKALEVYLAERGEGLFIEPLSVRD